MTRSGERRAKKMRRYWSLVRRLARETGNPIHRARFLYHYGVRPSGVVWP